MFRKLASRTAKARFASKSLTNNSRHYQTSTKEGIFGYRPPVPKPHYEIPESVLQSRREQSNIYRWVEAYRTHGHRLASVNAIALPKQQPEHTAELDPQRYGLGAGEPVRADGLVHAAAAAAPTTVAQLADYLQRTYAGSRVGVEFAHIESEHEREWLAERYERDTQTPLAPEQRRQIAGAMLRAENFDLFAGMKMPSLKRYGGEGAESLFAFLHQMFGAAADGGVEHVVFGMAHRGKLNMLATMLGVRPAKVFNKFRGNYEFPAGTKAMGDIPFHFHASEACTFNGRPVRVSVLHNPSHLEVVNPASMGKTRSRQQALGDGVFGPLDAPTTQPQRVLNVQVHGDCAFPGQGVNQETLMMAGMPHFNVGGSLHVVVNNQVGFTMPTDRGRSTRYATDLAKSIMAPIFHVNGDDPDAVAQVTRVAFDYQRQFGKDVFIDLNCYRQWGHNELDEPTFTNPLVYDIIHKREATVPKAYARQLIAEQILTEAEVKDILDKHTEFLSAEFAAVDTTFEPEAAFFKGQWSEMGRPSSDEVTTWDTGLDWAILEHVAEHSVQVPEGFNVHPHLLKTHIEARRKRIRDTKRIDWATAEAMAFGSLMYQGYNVRLSGEDAGRGTFSHRHAMLVDRQTNETFVPLNQLQTPGGQERCGKLEVVNSLLSEEAVLLFEYGMALDNPNQLIVWEAQYGDFLNMAQHVVDTFIASAETKWMYSNGLVLSLPHGFDGAASDHSSCRIERFLQLTDSAETHPDGDDVNLQVINPTTPAQYFHALRRQIVRNFRKPLVIASPKTLLRLGDATSTPVDFAPGTSFQPVLGDAQAPPAATVQRVILCSGKHYYGLQEERAKLGEAGEGVAIVRVESLCPFPVSEINAELNKYPNAKSFVWSQEEPRNMGAWAFVRPRFEHMCGQQLQYSGRKEAAATAVGSLKHHYEEVKEIVSAPFKL